MPDFTHRHLRLLFGDLGHRSGHSKRMRRRGRSWGCKFRNRLKARGPHCPAESDVSHRSPSPAVRPLIELFKKLARRNFRAGLGCGATARPGCATWKRLRRPGPLSIPVSLVHPSYDVEAFCVCPKLLSFEKSLKKRTRHPFRHQARLSLLEQY